MPRFSIVIPAYNVEAYLEQCLDSLLAQTFGDWEAVVVDDASPDGSGALADRLAASDPRITVVHKAANEGTHLARRTGMERCCGEYTVFLDGDDSLKPDCLALLDEALSADPVDSIHYGLVAQAAGSTSDEAAKAFERFNNEGEGTLARQELLTQVFFERGGYRRDWRVTNHAYKTEALKRAFEAMTPERLDRAEDAYEYLVICSVIEQEATRNDILGYVYNLGRGIINYDRLTPEVYASEAAQCQACIDASVDFARMSGDEALAEAASGAKVKLAEIVTNDWQNRVAPEDQAKAAELIASVLGPNEVAANLARLARDGAYRLWDTDVSLADDPSVERTFNLALELSDTAHVADDARARLDAAVAAAASHIGDLRRRDAERAERDLLADYDAQKVRILVSAHRDFARFDAKSLQMIQVGCAVNGGRLPDMLHDDEGDNDSGLNKMLCEMTAQYWAWKHVTDAEYVGFCHYRRYFNFSDTRYEENGWGEVMAGTIDEAAQRRFGLDDASIARAIKAVTPGRKRGTTVQETRTIAVCPHRPGKDAGISGSPLTRRCPTGGAGSALEQEHEAAARVALHLSPAGGLHHVGDAEVVQGVEPPVVQRPVEAALGDAGAVREGHRRDRAPPALHAHRGQPLRRENPAPPAVAHEGHRAPAVPPRHAQDAQAVVDAAAGGAEQGERRDRPTGGRDGLTQGERGLQVGHVLLAREGHALRHRRGDPREHVGPRGVAVPHEGVRHNPGVATPRGAAVGRHDVVGSGAACGQQLAGAGLGRAGHHGHREATGRHSASSTSRRVTPRQPSESATSATASMSPSLWRLVGQVRPSVGKPAPWATVTAWRESSTTSTRAGSSP